jgi:DDE superfamily endonuclease
MAHQGHPDRRRIGVHGRVRGRLPGQRHLSLSLSLCAAATLAQAHWNRRAMQRRMALRIPRNRRSAKPDRQNRRARWMPSMSRAWRMCSTSTPKRPIRSGRWYASTKARPSSSARCVSRSPPRRHERYDFEYKRNGTANLFVFLDAHRSWRKVKVTERRAAEDFAQCMRDLADLHYPQAERIRVVLDNLSTHSAAALYQALPASEARRILRRLEFHYTPKHAS